MSRYNLAAIEAAAKAATGTGGIDDARYILLVHPAAVLALCAALREQHAALMKHWTSDPIGEAEAILARHGIELGPTSDAEGTT